MKTRDLIAVLAAGDCAVAPARADRRFAGRLALALLLTAALVLPWLGPRADLAGAMGLPMFWAKLALPVSIAVASAFALHRLAHPGMRLGAWALAPLAPVLLAWAFAAKDLAQAGTGARWGLVSGQTWLVCVPIIALASLPAFALALGALRAMAPTRLVLAGAMAGLFAGSVAASVYALHCPEMAVPFLAVWYVGGMLVPAAAGAALGRRLLHW